MTLYDVIMMLIVVVAALQGAWRGMAWQIAPVASLVLGYMVAVPVSPAVAPYFGNPPINHIFALLAVYAATSLGVYLVVRSLKDSMDRLKLAEFDRHLGFLLGAVKGVVITLIITVTLVTASPIAREHILQSESHSIARTIIREVDPLLPKGIHDTIVPYLKEFHPDDLDHDRRLVDDGTPPPRRRTPRPSPARPARDTSDERADRREEDYRREDYGRGDEAISQSRPSRRPARPQPTREPIDDSWDAPAPQEDRYQSRRPLRASEPITSKPAAPTEKPGQWTNGFEVPDAADDFFKDSVLEPALRQVEEEIDRTMNRRPADPFPSSAK